MGLGVVFKEARFSLSMSAFANLFGSDWMLNHFDTKLIALNESAKCIYMVHFRGRLSGLLCIKYGRKALLVCIAQFLWRQLFLGVLRKSSLNSLKNIEK